MPMWLEKIRCQEHTLPNDQASIAVMQGLLLFPRCCLRRACCRQLIRGCDCARIAGGEGETSRTVLGLEQLTRGSSRSLPQISAAGLAAQQTGLSTTEGACKLLDARGWA